MLGRRRREFKKGFPSSYGIYLSGSSSGSFGSGSNSDSLCELGRSEVAICVRQWSSLGVTNSQWFIEKWL